MILIALGANLPGPDGASPRATCEGALAAMPARGIAVEAVSRWYRSAPVPPSDQPDYVNAVAAVATARPPRALLDALLEIEAAAGRRRGEANAARSLDLDLIDYGGRVCGPVDGLVLPHPRAHLRAFVLCPIADVASGWRHPVSGRSVAELIARLPEDHGIAPLEP